MLGKTVVELLSTGYGTLREKLVNTVGLGESEIVNMRIKEFTGESLSHHSPTFERSQPAEETRL